MSDKLCCLIFLCSIVAIIGCFGWVAGQANIKKLYAGIDESGNLCGVDKKTADLPFLYW